MAFPAQKKHRPSRRKLGKNQQSYAMAVASTLTGTGSTVVITFDAPCVIRGPVALSVDTLTFVSQVVNSNRQVTVTMSGAVATHAFTYASGDPNVTSYYGGTTLGGSGTF